MRHFFIFLITLYQKYISPYKGFKCAYGCYYKTLSCSTIIKNIIAEQGLLAGWPLIKQQFNHCHLAYQALETEREKREREKRERDLRHKPCFTKKDKCDCSLNSLECLPELPCDANPCNYYSFKKSIQSKAHSTHKYDIRE